MVGDIRFFCTIFVLYCTYVAADSCCDQPQCSQSCPWNNACDNGEDTECKDEISGPFKCWDRSICHHYEDCTHRDAAMRVGHICSSFPYYNGGYPMESLQIDDEQETCGCTRESQNGHYCSEWSVLEDSSDEFELGTGTCLQESANGQYCAKWKVEQEEYSKCWLVEYYDAHQGSSRTYTDCCYMNAIHDCCDRICSASFYNAFPAEHESADCECRVESSNGEFCLEWYCEEYGENGPSETWLEGLEKEIYTCSHDEPDDKYCTKWYGDIDGYEEFEVSKCVCQKQSNNGEYCNDWECHEFGADYYWRNLLWTFFSALMSLPFTLLSFYFLPRLFGKKTKLEMLIRMLFFCIGNAVWVAAFMIIGMWKAGLMVLIFVMPIHFCPIVFFYVLYRRASEDGAIVKDLRPTFAHKYAADDATSDPSGTVNRSSVQCSDRSRSPTTPLESNSNNLVIFSADQRDGCELVMNSNKAKRV